MARVIALDIGEKRIGVAVSDPLNITAQGLPTMERKSAEETLRILESFIKEYDVSKIIVGLPLNMDGTKGNSAKSAEGFVDVLKKRLTLDIEMVDERLTTAQGERLLLEADVSRKKRRQSLDKIAAQLILQAYLDSHVQKNNPQ